MQAALIREVGALPETVADHPEPQGELTVEVTAAPINPVDLSIAAGTFYAGPPHAPYVPGVEGVGRTKDNRRLWFETGAGYIGGGSMAERAPVAPERAIEIAADIPDALAGCLGVAGIAAWVPLAHRAQLQGGETVLILAATGAVGQIAVQAAKLLGAGHVIAAGRDEQKLEQTKSLGADATVTLPATADDLQQAAPSLIDVVLDPLWGGSYATTATEAMNVNGRLVMVGQSGGQEATFDAGVIRGKALKILGHSNATAPPEVKKAAYEAMCSHAANGELKVDYEELPLEQAREAWERQAASPHKKLILVP